MFFYPWNEWKERFRDILIHKELLKYNIICISRLLLAYHSWLLRFLVIEIEESIVLKKEEEQSEKLRFIYITFLVSYRRHDGWYIAMYVRFTWGDAGSSSSGGEGWILFDEPLCLRNIIFRWKKRAFFRKGELPAKAAFVAFVIPAVFPFWKENVSIFRP